MSAFQKASELDEHDPMPFLYTGIVEGDALEYGAAIESARQSQRRMPFLRSLNQAASNQKGNANLGAALANFGMEEWAGYYATEAYSPYWGGSHLFLADRYTGKFNKNSELFTGLLTDPMAFGASNRFSSLVSTPGNYGRVDLFLDRSDWTQWAAIGTFNGMRVEPTPFAYFLSGDLAKADAKDDDSTARGRNYTLGLGIKPRDDVSLFGFVTDSRLKATLKSASLTNDPMVQTESRADVGLNYKIAYENQLWFKVGAGHQDNDVSGFIVSQPTADALNQAFGTSSFGANGALNAFSSSIEQRDLQFRHAFTSSGVQWTWGAEYSTQKRTGDLGMTFAPVRIDIQQRDSVRSTEAYLSGLYRESGRYDAQIGLSRQAATLHRQDYSALDVQGSPGQLFTLEDGAAGERVSGWNPRVGVKWQLAPLQSLRAVAQKWRRPASAATLAPVDTVGVPVNDRLPTAGGLYERARVQFDGEIGGVSFAQVFLDHERVDNGLAGRQSAITGFEVTQLESLRSRPEVFSARADLEETPQFGEGRVDSLGLAFNHLSSRRQTVSARYLFRRGRADRRWRRPGDSLRLTTLPAARLAMGFARALATGHHRRLARRTLQGCREPGTADAGLVVRPDCVLGERRQALQRAGDRGQRAVAARSRGAAGSAFRAEILVQLLNARPGGQLRLFQRRGRVPRTGRLLPVQLRQTGQEQRGDRIERVDRLHLGPAGGGGLPVALLVSGPRQLAGADQPFVVARREDIDRRLFALDAYAVDSPNSYCIVQERRRAAGEQYPGPVDLVGGLEPGCEIDCIPERRVLEAKTGPILPTIAGPELRPTRSSSRFTPIAISSGCSRSMAACMSTAARTACNACSGSPRGAPQKAITASPMNLSTVPPCFMMAFVISLA